MPCYGAPIVDPSPENDEASAVGGPFERCDVAGAARASSFYQLLLVAPLLAVLVKK